MLEERKREREKERKSISYSYLLTSFPAYKGQKIAVAVSGGADSMALVLLADKWADGNIVTLTVDHGLRAESAQEAKKVSGWLGTRNIEHHILVWQGDKKSSNIQSEARDARYRLMTDFCKQNGIDTLLVAHNRQDQAETVLLRIMRGSGVDGLAAIAGETVINGVNILRPLLGASKADLKDFLQIEEQEWVEDPSNRNEKYARVRLRNFIENSDDPDLLVERLAETAENMARSRSYIDLKIAEDMRSVAEVMPEGYCFVDMDKFGQLHEEAAFKILSRLIKMVGGEYYKPRFEKIKNLHKEINDGLAKKVTLGGCVVFSDKGKAVIAREIADIEAEKHIAGSMVWDRRFTCRLESANKGSFTVGCLGADSFRKLCKEYPKLQKTALPKNIIYTLPALRKDGKIVSVPHLGFGEGLRAEFIDSY